MPLRVKNGLSVFTSLHELFVAAFIRLNAILRVSGELFFILIHWPWMLIEHVVSCSISAKRIVKSLNLSARLNVLLFKNARLVELGPKSLFLPKIFKNLYLFNTK